MIALILSLFAGFGCVGGHCSDYYVIQAEDSFVPCPVWQNPHGIERYQDRLIARCK